MSLPSVTLILKPWSIFDKVDPDILAAASARGQEVHSLLGQYLLDSWSTEIPTGVMGYYDSGRRWIDRYVKEAHAVEEEFIDELHGYQGHPDLVCTLVRETGKSLWDFKTGAVEQKSWRPQVAAYCALAEKAGHPITRSGCLKLRKDGKLAGVCEYTKTSFQDRALFLSALSCWRYFNG